MLRVGKRPDLCNACGDCEKICSRKFFHKEDKSLSAIQIHGETVYHLIVCSQCGDCIQVCPTKAIRKTQHTIVINKKDCIGCLSCVGFCPKEAMRYSNHNGEPFKCISCGLCVEGCQKGAIYMEEGGDLG